MHRGLTGNNRTPYVVIADEQAKEMSGVFPGK